MIGGGVREIALGEMAFWLDGEGSWSGSVLAPVARMAHADSAIERILANALGQDVSKLAAQERRQLLSRLLARFAHEVRNPLSSLHIHLQLLEEDFQDAPAPMREKSANRFEILQGELRRLENIVKRFLSLADPSALELESVRLTEIVSQVLALLRPEAEARNIEVGMAAPGDLPQVRADPGQLTQALVNLVINAIQAVGRDGAVRIQLEFESETGISTIRVSDSGPGIPSGNESAIFEPFFTTKSEGSGLGLWIVQQVMAAHGGEVDVSRSEEGGACFTLRLPLPRAEASRG